MAAAAGDAAPGDAHFNVNAAAAAEAAAAAGAAGMDNEAREALRRRKRNWKSCMRCGSRLIFGSAFVMVLALYGLGWQALLGLAEHLPTASASSRAVFGWLVVVLTAPACAMCGCALRTLLVMRRPTARLLDQDDEADLAHIQLVLENNPGHLQNFREEV